MTAATPLATRPAATPRLTLIQIEEALEFFTSRLEAGPGGLFESKLRDELENESRTDHWLDLVVTEKGPIGILANALERAGMSAEDPDVLGSPVRFTFHDDGTTSSEPYPPGAAKATGPDDDLLGRFVKAGMEAQRAVDEALRKALVGTNITPNPVNLARALQLAQQVREMELEADRRQTELNQLRGQLVVRRREAAAAFVDPQPHLFDPLPPASTDGTGTHNPPEPVSEATPAPLQPDAGGDAPAKLIPGHLYELRELANISDEALEAGLAKPPRHLRPIDKRDGSPGDGGQVGNVLGIAGHYYAVIQCRMQHTQKTFTLQPCLALNDWYAANPGAVPETWQQRRDVNDDVAPEDVPLEGVSVSDNNGMTWVLLDDIDQVEILVPIERKAPAPPPAPPPASGVEKAMELLKPAVTFIKTNYSGPYRVIAARPFRDTVSLTIIDVKAKPRKNGTWPDKGKGYINDIRLKDGKFSMNHGDTLEIISEQEAVKLHDAGGVQEKIDDEEEEQPAPPPKKPAARPSLLDAAARSNLRTPEQPPGQSMKWGPWKGSLLSALHKFKVDVGDVLPTGEALEMYNAGKKPSVAAQQYVASLGKAGKALDKIEHTTSSATAIAAGNGSAKKGGSHGRRR